MGPLSHDPSESVPATIADTWAALRRELKLLGDSGPPCTAAPEAWFASPSDPALEDAVQGCLGCPVRAECLAYAEAAGEPWGVWGGLRSDERGFGRISGRKTA